MMTRRLLVLLVACLMTSPATAQQSFATGAAINDQRERLAQARRHWFDICLKAEADGTAVPYGEMDDAFVQRCERLLDQYKYEVDTLVRLIHGDPATYICSPAGCPQESN